MSYQTDLGLSGKQSAAHYWLYCDGASRGNPGRASIGMVILDATEEEVYAQGRLLGNGITNNVAEYESLCAGLEMARQLGIEHLTVRMDSELVVRQMQGRYKVKNPGLRPLFEKARALCRRIPRFHIEHVRREDNQRADELANQALDEKADT